MIDIQNLLKGIDNQTSPTMPPTAQEPEKLVQEETISEPEQQEETPVTNEYSMLSLSQWWQKYKREITSVKSLNIIPDEGTHVIVDKCIIFVAPSKQDESVDDLYPVVKTHKIKVPDLAPTQMLMYNNGYMIEFQINDEYMRWYGLRITHTIFYGTYHRGIFIPTRMDISKSKKNLDRYKLVEMTTDLRNIPFESMVDVREFHNFYDKLINESIPLIDVFTKLYERHDKVKDVNHAIKILHTIMKWEEYII